MSHILLWLNRILFLKLIEANLLAFNEFDKALNFLSSAKIKSFKALSHLFFEVLAKDYENRTNDRGFHFLPYLNSSLFIKDEKLEILDIALLDDTLEIEVFQSTQSTHKAGSKCAFLVYLFDFLNAFDFGKKSTQEDSAQEQDSKELIQSSVLGAVFEKLNGYKEGSFYTPSFITSYMCRESLSKIVVEKFNAAFEWNAQDLGDLRKLIDRDFNKTESKAKQILSEIRICDPAVGSGHFLVSALNEIIAIYHRLGLLGFGYKDLQINNDEIYLITKEGATFAYKRQQDSHHAIQKSLFELKKSIIENNLFGVDINPNSCNIARLRLWIELLKNAYYLNFTKDKDSKTHKLQTLPNIDINIKCGNSLISHFDTYEYDEDKNPQRGTFAWLRKKDSTFSKNFKEKLLRYNNLVQIYKEKLGDKSQIDTEINALKAYFKDTLLNNGYIMESLEKHLGAFVRTYGDSVFDIETPFGMEMIKIIRKKNAEKKSFKFQPTLEELEPKPIDKKGQDLLALIHKEFETLESLRKSDTFEWRFAFPEVLDLETFEEKQKRVSANNAIKATQSQRNMKEKPQEIKDTFGDFKGFDLVIGNPPYIKEADNKRLFDGTRHLRTYQGKMDIWYHFVGKGFDIAKNKGIVTFIATQNWTTNTGAKNLRNVILQEAKILNLIDFGSYMCFDSASIQTMIMEFQKLDSIPESYQINYAKIESKKPTDTHREAILNKEVFEDNLYLEPSITPTQMQDKPLTFADSKQEEVLNKILGNGTFYLQEDEIAQGIVPNPDCITKRNITKNLEAKGIKVGDGVFVISKNSLKISKDEKKYLKPLFEVEHCKKYYFDSCNTQEIIYTTKQNCTLKQIPNLAKHLARFQEIMNNRRENINGRLNFFHLHWARDEFFFKKGNKILCVRKCVNTPIFSYTENEAYVMLSLNVIKTSRINLKFLTALLNSKLIAFWLKHKGKMQGNNYQIDKEPLMNIPLIEITKTNQKIADNIIALVDKILTIKAKNKDSNSLELENEIDKLVYKLYNLTDEEIKIIKE